MESEGALAADENEEETQVVITELDAASESEGGRSDSSDLGLQHASNFSGVRKRKRGEYVAEKWDPIKKKRVWLGTFNTVEEATEAYLAKQCEFAHLNQASSQSPAYAQRMHDEMPSSNSTNTTGGAAAERSKVDHGKMPFIREISFRDKSPLLGAEWHNMGRLRKDPFKKKQVCKGFNSNMHESEKLMKVVNQGKEPRICVGSSEQTTCSMSKSSDRCNTWKRNPKAKTGLLGIRKQKNGRYGAEIRDPIKHKQIWLGTFDTVEEASQAYLSKKSEFDMLSQGNKQNKPKNCDQTQPESSAGASFFVANDQTLHAASVGRNKKTDSPKTTRIVGVHKNKWGKYTSEIIDPISKKKIWLGTFGSHEEASRVYQSKKLEFQKLVKPKKKCNQKIHPTAREKQVEKEKLVDVKQGHLNCEGFQPESAAAETFHAYQHMKFDVQRSEEAELQSNMPIDFSKGEKEGGQEDADLWMGEWVQLPDGREVKFSLKLGLPIIDNYGSLLGGMGLSLSHISMLIVGAIFGFLNPGHLRRRTS
ncbi:hypothetical protein HAX54_003092 [Datura stramonium]|uniref:AP2/ERF domain-containing protein n=1 Tax=Datura stramonium TaxID=4076 RepID=A0ABS8RTE2_DATST|nr:hypothetical protein [Datura stramonium]